VAMFQRMFKMPGVVDKNHLKYSFLF